MTPRRAADAVDYVRIGSEPWVDARRRAFVGESAWYFLLVTGHDLRELRAGRVPGPIRAEARAALRYAMVTRTPDERPQE